MRESLARWQANGCSMFHDDAPKLRALDGERDLITEKQSKNATEQRSVAGLLSLRTPPYQVSVPVVCPLSGHG
jgi:hypothetical protein